MKPRVLAYTCKKCGTSIDPNTNRKLVFCKCGKIGIDGTLVNSRIVGDKNFLIVETEKKETFVYRIKHIKTGQFFTPYRYPSPARFTEKGKFYSKKPSLNWVSYLVPIEECVIEKYKLVNC